MSNELDTTTLEIRAQLSAALVTAKAATATARQQLAKAMKNESAITRAIVALGGNPVSPKPLAPKPTPGPRPAAKETPKPAAGGVK